LVVLKGPEETKGIGVMMEQTASYGGVEKGGVGVDCSDGGEEDHLVARVRVPTTPGSERPEQAVERGDALLHPPLVRSPVNAVRLDTRMEERLGW